MGPWYKLISPDRSKRYWKYQQCFEYLSLNNVYNEDNSFVQLVFVDSAITKYSSVKSSLYILISGSIL